MLEFIQNNLILSVFIAYFAVISLISIIVCIYDKVISKKNKVELRVPEKTLMLLSFLGGGVAMYLCMLAIRHKTKHVRFMLGIPIIIALHGNFFIPSPPLLLLYHNEPKKKAKNPALWREKEITLDHPTTHFGGQGLFLLVLGFNHWVTSLSAVSASLLMTKSELLSVWHSVSVRTKNLCDRKLKKCAGEEGFEFLFVTKI